MKRRILRPIAVGVATLSTVATMAIGAVSSQAASNGAFTITPATGDDSLTLVLDTASKCPGGTNFQIAMSGPGFPAAGYGVTANNQDTILPTNPAGGYSVPLNASLSSAAAAQVPPAVLNGTYTFQGTCKNGFGAATFGTFDGSIVFTQHVVTGSPTTFTYVANNPTVSVSTTTSLGSTPASPVNTGDPVAFTAHVSAASGTAAGTVQLMDGTAPIGSPTAVNATGDAAINTSFATAGTHSVTAAFTGASGFADSVSAPPIVYTVSQSPATPTTTGLAISPTTADANTPVTLTATVSPTAAAGKVQFSDGATALGSPVTVAGGTAVLTQTYPAGPHSFTAAFTPTNASAFSGSASTSQALTVTAGASNVVSETLETVVAAGSLTISVTDPSKVLLAPPALNAAGTFLTTTGAIRQVTVSDTRAGNPGWTVSGQASDFFGPGGASIVGSNLGWTPKVTTMSAGQTVTAGGVIAPATPPLLTNPAADPGTGLHFGRTLASATAGHGTGFALLDATLALTVPTTTVAGTYDATLTLTAI